MAGYFDYVGRIFTEKGSWYKILLITFLQTAVVLFNPKETFQQMTVSSSPEFNIPGIILYILASLLIYGFVIQIYHSFMNNKQNLLPDIDFMDMVAKAFKMLPFSLCWGFYLFLTIFVFYFFIFTGMMTRGGLNPAIFLVMFLVIVFYSISISSMMIIHSKSFSYSHVLNPITPFRIFPSVILPLLLLFLSYGLVAALLYGLLFGGAFLIRSAGGEAGGAGSISFGILLVIFGYLNNVTTFAYCLKFADIVKTKLEYTDFLDDELGDAVADDDSSDVDESVDY